VGSYKVAKFMESLREPLTHEQEAAAQKGMQEFDKQTKDLDNLDNLQL